MKFFTANQGYTASGLLHYGIDHIASAGVLLLKAPRCYDSAGYLAHLGFELLLKALWLKRYGQFPGTHDLKRLLVDLEGRPVLNLPDTQSDVLDLRQLFGEIRYPIPNHPVSIGDEDWGRIKELYDCFETLLAQEMNDEFESIAGNRKGDRILMTRPVEEERK